MVRKADVITVNITFQPSDSRPAALIKVRGMDHSRISGCVQHAPSVSSGQGERLLAQHMLARSYRIQRVLAMRIGRRDDVDRVNFGIGEHLHVVGVALCNRPLRLNFLKCRCVSPHECHDLRFGDLCERLHVRRSEPTGSDDADAE